MEEIPVNGRDFDEGLRWGSGEDRQHADWGQGGEVPGHPGFAASPQPRREAAAPSARRLPRSYQRSDERIREEVFERLIAREDLDVEHVEVDVTGGNVRLGGEVPDRETRRAIEDIAELVLGVRDIDNHLKLGRGLVASVVDAFTGAPHGVQQHSGVGAMGASRDTSHDPAPAAGGAPGTVPQESRER